MTPPLSSRGWLTIRWVRTTFDYGTTGIEKRALFYRTILPLLEFGREREAAVDEPL